MTIIVGSKGALYADSGRVIDFGQWYSRLTNDAVKIFISPCKRVAIASTGFAVADFERKGIIDFFIGRIAAQLANDDKNDALVVTYKQRQELQLPAARYIVMTTHGFYQYDHAGGWAGAILFSQIDDTIMAGMPIQELHTALGLGMEMVPAMTLACSFCTCSRPPINSVSVASLVPFGGVEKTTGNFVKEGV